MRISKRLFRVLLSLCVCFLACGFILKPLVSYAAVSDLLIGTGSNALMTMDLSDGDYSVMPMSTLGTVSNTVSDIHQFYATYLNPDTGQYVTMNPEYEIVNNRFRFSFKAPTGCIITQYGLTMLKPQLPSPGTYKFSFDFASDFSYDYTSSGLVCVLEPSNAAVESKTISFYNIAQYFSGDAYLSPYTINLTNLTYATLYFNIPASQNLNQIGGSISLHFERSGSDSSAPSTGNSYDSSDYEYGVENSLSDLSSSVDEVSDEIGFVAEAIQNLQGAMEPHYSNVLTQLHHITEQLHAFYDQVYNNIHLPELDMLTQIKTAIENIDLQIEVDISEVKTAINNMSTAVQNKLQSTTDQITGGYDNSGIVQENEKLEQSINDYDEVESEIFDEAGGFVGEFEYPSVDSLSGSVVKALAFVGSFLQSIFLSMGDFSSIITFSLTMIFVMVVVGYHRIRS